jgi:hypothetical protein
MIDAAHASSRRRRLGFAKTLLNAAADCPILPVTRAASHSRLRK